MTKVFMVKGCDVEIEMSDSTFKPTRKKPTLAIRQGNEVIKVASFDNWDSVLFFADILEKMFNQQNEVMSDERAKVLKEVRKKYYDLEFGAFEAWLENKLHN